MLRVIAAVVLLISLPVRALNAETVSADRQKLEALASAGVTESFFAGYSDSRISLYDWVMLKRSPELLKILRSGSRGFVERRAVIVREVGRMLMIRGIGPANQRLFDELASHLEFQALATDSDLQMVFDSGVGEVQALAAQALEQASALDTPVKFRLARALLLSAATEGDLPHRLHSLQAIERFSRVQGDVRHPVVGLPAQVAQAEAVLEAYQISAERSWLSKLVEVVQQIPAEDPAVPEGQLPTPLQRAEAVARVRFLSLLVMMEKVTGNAQYRQQAEDLAGRMAAARLSDSGLVGGLLAGLHRLSEQPLHVTIVSSRNDVGGRRLFEQGVLARSDYRLLEWLEPFQVGPGKRYPDLGRPAAYVCIDKRCSLPQFDAPSLLKTVQEMAR